MPHGRHDHRLGPGRKKELPGVQALTYVNSPAEAKAESDACCTSANVVQLLRSLTSAITAFCKENSAPELIIMTEEGIRHQLNKFTNKPIIFLKT